MRFSPLPYDMEMVNVGQQALNKYKKSNMSSLSKFGEVSLQRFCSYSMQIRRRISRQKFIFHVYPFKQRQIKKKKILLHENLIKLLCIIALTKTFQACI